jgi:hypothetical protein
MTSIRKIIITCSALALSAGVAMAQGGGGQADGAGRWGRDGQDGHGMAGHGMQGRGMHGGRMHHRGMHRRMHDPIARLLEHQTLLHLTPAQVNSIISIDDKLHSDNKPLFERLMAMHSSHRRTGDQAAHTPPSAAERDSAMTVMRSARENVWRATAAADAVLTPEQLNTAGGLDRAGHPGMGMMFRRPGMGPEMGPPGRGNGQKGD